jgi:hypothetical protein
MDNTRHRTPVSGRPKWGSAGGGFRAWPASELVADRPVGLLVGGLGGGPHVVGVEGTNVKSFVES